MQETNTDSIYTIETGKLDIQTWSKLLLQFNDASIYQTWSYASVLYGSDNISHLLVKKAGEVVAIAQIGIRHYPYLFTGTANVHWGPLWKKKGKTDDIEHFTHIITAIKNEYGIKRGLLVRLWPNEVFNTSNQIINIFISNNFSHNLSEPPYRTIILDITPSLEVLRRNLDQKWRNQLNRAEKNNQVVTDATSDDYYQVFLTLQKEMRERKNFTPGVDYKVYQKIQNHLTENQKMRIFVCNADARAVSVSICSGIGDIGIYLLGATGDHGMKLNGSNLLQWEILKWLKKQGCRYYDLGGIDPVSNPGVYRFKCGIAGKTGQDVCFIGQYFFCNNFLSGLLFKFIEKTKFIRNTLSHFQKNK